MTETAYYSTAPEVVDATRRRDSADTDWGNALKDLGREAFGREVRFSAYSGDRFASFDVSFDEALPAGWRYNDKACGAVPDKRTKEGRAWAKRLEPLLHVPTVKIPGQPEAFLSELTFRKPVFGFLGDVVWCKWSDKPPEGVDESLWTLAKRSEFYAAMEAADEAES